MSAMRCSGVHVALGLSRADPKSNPCHSFPDVTALTKDCGVEWACTSMVRKLHLRFMEIRGEENLIAAQFWI